MTGARETGFKWWMRYIVVPIIGGDGIVAIIVALIAHPSASSQTGKSKHEGDVTLEVSDLGSKELWKTNRIEYRNPDNVIHIRWDVSNPNGTLLLVDTDDAKVEQHRQIVGSKGNEVISVGGRSGYIFLQDDSGTLSSIYFQKSTFP